MHSKLIITAVVLATGVFGTPVPDSYVEHERREVLLPLWKRVSDPVARGLVPVRIGMTQNNLDNIEDLLMEVSDHESPKYGKHYTQDQINDLFAPSNETVDAILAWLESAGLAKHRISQSFNKQWLQFDSRVSELEDLLKTKYHVYEHERGHTHLACEKYHVPADIAHHIDYITPGVKMMSLRDGKPPSKLELEKRREKKKKDKASKFIHSPYVVGSPPKMSAADVAEKVRQNDLSLCSAVITPNCLRAMYNITKPVAKLEGEILGIFEDLGDHYSQEDLNLFFNAIATNIPQGTHPVLKGVDGATGPAQVSDAGFESDLDFQISFPVIYPAKSVLFQTDDDYIETHYEYGGFLNNFFDAIDGSYCSFNPYNQTLPPRLDPHYPDPHKGGYHHPLQCGAYTPTDVVSVSYDSIEFGLPEKYQRRQCMEIGKLGMQGISVIVSSGDYGVSSFPDSISPNGCILSNLTFSTTENGTIFSPLTPVNCPFTTSLGATFLPAGADPKIDAETAVTRFASGGGFSNLYTAPKYQKKAVEGYLTKYPPPYPYYSITGTNGMKHIGRNGGIYNIAGRGYPDFAAVGDNVLLYHTGRPTTIGGTSAAAPFFASLIARINVERQNKGMSSVGFVNPVLYAHPEVFHDITVGSNPGCNTTGFAVTPGWDPVTGLGTPNYEKMLALFLSL